jgi:uncharacterized protein (DUF58 family)
MALKLTKRKAGLLVLLGLIVFYTFGTGFAFFFRLLYVLLLLLVVGLGWAWLNLRGIEVRLTRLAHRGQVGGYLDGQIQVINRNRLPKSWLEVKEVSDLPGYTAGRGVGLVRDQSRAWRVEIYLARRGVFKTGQVEVTSQDPFGLFRLSRRFLEPQEYIVLPATEPLPDLDPGLANLPSDSRITRRSDHITPDSSSVREYVSGDSFRRIHWPYTARMNNLMVKEFDIGISAESWVLLDMYRSSHLGADEVDNTEELCVRVAASLISRLDDLSMPVGLAANAERAYILRPDSSPAQAGKLMEALATMRASGNVSLERFIYDLRPSLSRFNTLTVITPSRRTEWISALSSLRRQGVGVAVMYIDPVEFGAPSDVHSPLELLFMNDIPTYMLKRGQPINEALRAPLQSADFATYVPAGPSSKEKATV